MGEALGAEAREPDPRAGQMSQKGEGGASVVGARSERSPGSAKPGARRAEEPGSLGSPGRRGRRARTPSDSAARSRRSCHPMSGECSCLPGWAGLHCNESCPQDTHGPGCQEHCLCLHGGVCQPDSGRCRCAPGYTVRRGAGRTRRRGQRRGRAAPSPAPAPPLSGPALRQPLPPRHLWSRLQRALLLRQRHRLLAGGRRLRVQGG